MLTFIWVRVAECSGALVSPAICRLRVQFSSLPGHATLITAGAWVNVTRDLYAVAIVHKGVSFFTELNFSKVFGANPVP